MTSLAVGFGRGLFVGAQPGPVSLLCIRSVLRGALASGVAIGAGAALIDLLYAGLGLAGAASLLEADAPRRLVFWWSAPGEEATRVEIDLDELDDGTRVRVTESRPLAILDGRDLAVEFDGAGDGAAGPLALAGGALR